MLTLLTLTLVLLISIMLVNRSESFSAVLGSNVSSEQCMNDCINEYQTPCGSSIGAVYYGVRGQNGSGTYIPNRVCEQKCALKHVCNNNYVSMFYSL